ncbi:MULTISPECIES: hypothetical protein [unclassified Bradyrhizobium]|uniref:hypothetical protein n=1 Tax=unclassified Bradyrhizobium TaxID=2631580 RepID=UPI0028E85EFE|nr:MULTISPECIES: hypothetical protein [unclassified Bradyrhizobium]
MTIPPCPRGSRHCRHYSYVRGEGPQCEAGIDMSAPAAALQCMPPEHQKGATCDWREEYTDAEREARREWLTERTARMAIVLQEIPENSNSGRMTCPACGTGTVQWVRARSNGHLHAGCSTPNCFSVMQ